MAVIQITRESPEYNIETGIHTEKNSPPYPEGLNSRPPLLVFREKEYLFREHEADNLSFRPWLGKQADDNHGHDADYLGESANHEKIAQVVPCHHVCRKHSGYKPCKRYPYGYTHYHDKQRRGRGCAFPENTHKKNTSTCGPQTTKYSP